MSLFQVIFRKRMDEARGLPWACNNERIARDVAKESTTGTLGNKKGPVYAPAQEVK